MKAKSALTLALTAGLCGTAAGEIPFENYPAQTGMPKVQKHEFIGHIYYKVATGETVFTPAAEYEANRATARRATRAPGDDINGDGTGDFFVATNTAMCVPGPLGTQPDGGLALLDGPALGVSGDWHHYKAQFNSTDNLISSIQLSFFTDIADIDTDGDGFGEGQDGKGYLLALWDREDVTSQNSSVCPVGSTSGTGLFSRVLAGAYLLQGLAGPTTAPPPGFVSGVLTTFDFEGVGETEIADSDGLAPTTATFNSGIGTADVLDLADLDGDSNFFEPDGVIDMDNGNNGTLDWGYSVLGIQPTATISGGTTGTPATGIIAYLLASPGALGTGGTIELTPSGNAIPTTPVTTAPFGDTTDGIVDYYNRNDGFAPNQGDQSILVRASEIEPMGVGIPLNVNALVPTVPGRIMRFTVFVGALDQTPSPLAVPGAGTCPGLPQGDFFVIGGTTHDTDGDTLITPTTVGGADQAVFSLNCESDVAEDTNGDTVVDTTVDGVLDGESAPNFFISLGGPADFGGTCPCDVEGDGDLDPDDINAFVTLFTTTGADIDGDGDSDPDDIARFVSCFTDPENDPSGDCSGL